MQIKILSLKNNTCPFWTASVCGQSRRAKWPICTNRGVGINRQGPKQHPNRQQITEHMMVNGLPSPSQGGKKKCKHMFVHCLPPKHVFRWLWSGTWTTGWMSIYTYEIQKLYLKYHIIWQLHHSQTTTEPTSQFFSFPNGNLHARHISSYFGQFFFW